MEKLWSPWRSQYIDSFNNKEKKSVCIFCDMIEQDADDLSNLVVGKGKLTITVLNLYPYNNGHMMVVPKRHTNDFSTLTQEEKSEIFTTLQLCEKSLRNVLNPDAFNIGANLGKSAGAGIDEHLHFHIVPRWNGDTNFMPVLGETKVISQELSETKKNLRSWFQDFEKSM